MPPPPPPPPPLSCMLPLFSGEYMTPRWREPDSNPRSPVRVTGKRPRCRSLWWSGKCRRCPAPAEGCRSLQAAFLATKSLRFNSLLQEYRMTDLIKALRERREELRNELQEHPLFQEYELVCRLLERREASVSTPDTGSDQLLLDLGGIGASALSAEEVGGRLDYRVHPLVSPCEWGRSVDRQLLRSWLTLGRWLTLRSLRSKRRRC